jgi:uncharacterized protein YbjT (DUF2867 family)
MNILVTGATGLVGAEVVRQAIIDDDIRQITCLVRRAGTLQHPKVKYIVHNNFLDYSSLVEVFREQDACIWALGVSQTQVSKEKYHEITHDYAVAAAKAMLIARPDITFLFVSGEGADPTETSKTLFARVKGKTENTLMRLNFQKLIIARPGAIRPVNKNKNAPFLYKLALPLFPIMQFLTPSKVINSVKLALALLFLLKKNMTKQILENPDLQALVKD